MSDDDTPQQPDLASILPQLMANQRAMQDVLAKQEERMAELQAENTALRQQLQGPVTGPAKTVNGQIIRDLGVQAIGNEEANVFYKGLRMSEEEERRRMESPGGKLG